MKFIIFIFSFYLFSHSFLFSQISPINLSSEKSLIQFSIDNWNRSDGLPTNQIIDICQSKDGYIWISSYSGLIRFDGIKFKVFDKTNVEVLNENGIGALDTDKNGTLWITTQSSGLISYNEGKFESHGSDQNVENLFSVIYIDSKNRIWSASAKEGWFVYDRNTFKFLQHTSSLKNIDLKSIFESRDGNFWFGTAGEGLFKYDHDKIVTYTEEDGLISNWIRTIYIDENNLIWIGTDKGLCTFDGEKFKTVLALKGFTVNNIINDNLGNVWLSTSKGLFRKKYQTEFYEYLSTSNGLLHNDVNNLLIDFENSLWIINYKAGLSRIKNCKFISYTQEKGMSGTIVNSVCEYKPGSFLVAFNNGYINKIENGAISEFKTKNSLIGSKIRHIFKDSKENIWISSYSGLLKILPNKNEILYNEEYGFPGKYIRMTFEDSKNNIWVGTRNNGLIKINTNKTYTYYNKSNGLSSNLIMSINEDNNGNIIIGTSKGGINIISDDKTIKHFSKDDGLTGDIIFNTYIDLFGNTWIATNGGLNCLINNKLLSITINDSNFYSAPFDILEDYKGNLWMPSAKGIMKINKQSFLNFKSEKVDTFKCDLYNEHDGLIQSECTSTAKSLKGSDGTLWFPTINGISTVNLNDLPSNDYVPPVYIEELSVNNSIVKLSESIIIEPGKNRLTFSYTALSYHQPKNVQFRYCLEGFNNEWSDAVTKRFISYTNLPHGDYIFKVIACNNDGLWNMEGDELAFTIKPHFYQTSIFYITVVLSILFLIYFIHKIKVRSLKRVRSKLEKTVNIRTQEISVKNKELVLYQDHLEDMIIERTNDLEIAKLNAERANQHKTSFLENLSHEIRTPLNAIVGFSTLLENEDNLSLSIKESIGNINSGSISLTKVVDSIMQASRIQLGDISIYETKFSIYDLINEICSELKKSVIFHNKEGLNIKYNTESVKDYIIVCDKERLNSIIFNLVENAVKFTETGYVEIGATIDKENILNVYVKDTGIGILEKDLKHIFKKFNKIESDKSSTNSGLGLGLNISKNIINILNGTINVESVIGEGSTFYFSIPLKRIKKVKPVKIDLNPFEIISFNISGKKILIAEDEKLNLIFLKTILGDSGAKIISAENGSEAVKKFQKNKDIELILMDIKMPILDGIEATKQIRNLNKDNNVKIIAQTAYTMDYQKAKILSSGFDDYLEKPIDVNIMMKIINKCLKK